MDEIDKPFSLMAYSNAVGIPMSTLAKNIVGKVMVGVRVISKCIVPEETTRVLINVIISHDRKNTPKGVVPLILDTVMKLCPCLLHKPVADAWRRMCWKNNLKVLKPNSMIAEATMTKNGWQLQFDNNIVG
jgi:hypothetical protein